MISGIIESNRVNLPQICLKEKCNIDLESGVLPSKIQQKERWLDNPNVNTDTFYLPFMQGF